MLYSISVPGRDYSSIKNYLKRGYPTNSHMMELLGRVYETAAGDCVITAQVLQNQAAILYTLTCGETVIEKIMKVPICHFTEMGVTVAFDIDRTYE